MNSIGFHPRSGICANMTSIFQHHHINSSVGLLAVVDSQQALVFASLVLVYRHPM
jgi:hypothetical protein